MSSSQTRAVMRMADVLHCLWLGESGVKYWRSAILGMIALGAASAFPARAETPADPDANCAAADAAATSKLDAIRAGRNLPANFPIGDLIASLQRARALCREGQPERGVLVYMRVSDALRDALPASRPGTLNPSGTR